MRAISIPKFEYPLPNLENLPKLKDVARRRRIKNQFWCSVCSSDLNMTRLLICFSNTTTKKGLWFWLCASSPSRTMKISNDCKGMYSLLCFFILVVFNLVKLGSQLDYEIILILLILCLCCFFCIPTTQHRLYDHIIYWTEKICS